MDWGIARDWLRAEWGVVRRAPFSVLTFGAVTGLAGWHVHGMLVAERLALVDTLVRIHETVSDLTPEQLESFKESLAQAAPGEVEILSTNPESLFALSGAISDAGWHLEGRSVVDSISGVNGILLEAPDGIEGDALRAAFEAGGIDFGYRVLEQGETPRVWLDQPNVEFQ